MYVDGKVAHNVEINGKWYVNGKESQKPSENSETFTDENGVKHTHSNLDSNGDPQTVKREYPSGYWITYDNITFTTDENGNKIWATWTTIDSNGVKLRFDAEHPDGVPIES